MEASVVRVRVRRCTALLLPLAVAGCGGGGSGGGDATGPLPAELVSIATSVGRAEHTVTSLPNGDLLIAGGTGAGGGALASTEILDASALGGPTSPVVVAGSLATPRTRHTATLLASGDVVAIGGAGTGAIEVLAPVAATPALSTWTTAPVATLATPRARHTATRLLDGRVLVVGGETTGGAALGSAELFVAAGAPVVPAAPLGTPRRDHAAVLLPDGRVLVVGGRDAAGLPLATAELYTPGTDSWSPAANALTSARALPCAALLDGGAPGTADDRVVVAGGATTGGVGAATAELFDPATDTFSAGGALEGPGVFDAACAVLPNGQLAIAGGYTSGGAAAGAGPVRESVLVRLGSGLGVGAQDLLGRRGACRAGVVASTGPAGGDLVVVGGYDEAGLPRAELQLLRIDDEARALADTLSDEEALAFAVFATGFHILYDGASGWGDVDLEIESHPIFGRLVTGHVGNFDVDLEFDAGSITGYVEGKSYRLTVRDGWAVSPDLEVDFRPSGHVDGDMDVAAQDFDFDVDRDPGLFRGYVVGYDAELRLRVEVDGDHTDADDSFLDVYAVY